MAATVLLGVPDSHLLKDQDYTAGWSTNKFGGVPNWLPECLPSQHPRCSICNSFLYQVTQIYCPLEGSEFHRSLNIFGCLNKGCEFKSGSWKVLRSQYAEGADSSKKQHKQKSDDFFGENWGSDADDWGSDDGNEVNLISTTFGEMRMKENQDISVPEDTSKRTIDADTKNFQHQHPSKDVPKFASVFIHVLEEPESHTDESFDYEKSLLRAYEERECSVPELGANAKASEKYEKTSIADGDVTLHKFLKQIRKCPEQCLRYQWNGNPLFLSEKFKYEKHLDNVPLCSNCGSERVFEIQLMPALTSILRVAERDVMDDNSVANDVIGASCLSSEGENDIRMDFGTVFIYTCRKSCNKTENLYNVPVEEFIIVQPCPDSDLLDIKLP